MTEAAPTHRILNSAGQAPLVLICDHASKVVPPELHDLGLTQEEIARHIGWDIGAARLTEILCQRLDAPGFCSAASRLVVDCNRAPDDPTLICEVSDGVVVPGNRDVDEAERQRRLGLYFHPYHRAVAEAVQRKIAAGPKAALLSIHSFTPRMKGRQRPWHVGILWDRDARLPAPLMQALGEEPGIVVGDNEPYSGRSRAGYSIRAHGEAHDLPHVLVEVRQDLIGDEAGVLEWADRLERCFRQALAEAGILLQARKAA